MYKRLDIMKKCFVIMPYGGEDEKKRKHYLGVYSQIIRAAAIEAGFLPEEIKRSDIAATPGNILSDIVDDLYSSDIVVADLSEGNANVFWELGVRHTLAKSGTVTIIDENHRIPFDMHQYRIIQYSTANLGSISDVVAQIKDAIIQRLSNPKNSDNAVHDTLPSLPIRFSDYDSQTESDLLKTRINELVAENKKLTTKISEIDPAGTLRDGTVDVIALIDNATEIYKTTGQHLVLRLASSRDESTDAFISELKTAIRNPYLSKAEFLHIRSMCKEIGLEHHQRAVLEIATERFPADDDIKLALIDAYDDANSLNLQERGRLMIEEFMGIKHQAEGPIATNKLNTTRQSISLLFNFYFSFRKLEWIVKVAESIENLIGPSSLVTRNKARALGKLGLEEQALTEFQRAVELDSSDDTAWLLYGDYEDDIGRYKEAYEKFEKAIFADPNDETRIFYLGRHIAMRGFVRMNGEHIEGPVEKSERMKYTMPFVNYVIEKNPQYRIVDMIVRFLVGEKALAEASAISEGRIPNGDYNEAALHYVLNNIKY
jgi:tetratricopeptide (TPR) repeat protein